MYYLFKEYVKEEVVTSLLFDYHFTIYYYVKFPF